MTGFLLTGASGLIGGELAARLMGRGHAVHCLVHRDASICANDGSPAEVSAVYRGDIQQPEFGLNEATVARLRQSCQVLIHCAATTRFDLSEQEYSQVNVVGTRHAIALARRCGMSVLHVSTAYVCGPRFGPVAEDDPLPVTGFANGYEASKAAAELVVATSGLRHAIVRPSIVVGDSQTGAIRRFDVTYQVFRQIAEGRLRQLPATAGATLDFVPLDHVAAGTVAVAERLDAASGVYHLVAGQPITVESFARVIGSYPQLAAPELIEPRDFDIAALGPAERRLYRHGAAVYASYFQRAPRFDDSRMKALTGLECNFGGEQLVRRLIDWCIASGFLRQPEQGVSERADSGAPDGVGRQAPRAFPT